MDRNNVKIIDWRQEMERQEDAVHALGGGKADEAEHGHFDVSVEYVGPTAMFRVRPDELIDAVLEKALHAFGVRHEKQRFALFTESGVRLPLDETVDRARIRPHEKIALRFEIFVIYNGVVETSLSRRQNV
jgi:hypothetical protein